jgi:hypothetical protein
MKEDRYCIYGLEGRIRRRVRDRFGILSFTCAFVFFFFWCSLLLRRLLVCFPVTDIRCQYCGLLAQLPSGFKRHSGVLSLRCIGARMRRGGLTTANHPTVFTSNRHGNVCLTNLPSKSQAQHAINKAGSECQDGLDNYCACARSRSYGVPCFVRVPQISVNPPAFLHLFSLGVCCGYSFTLSCVLMSFGLLTSTSLIIIHYLASAQSTLCQHT